MGTPAGRVTGRIRVAVVGCGRIARLGHVPAYLALADLVEVVAVADPSDEDRDRVADLLGVPAGHRHRAVDELLAAHTVDVVDVAVPNALHRPVIEAAARAGAHVVVEKPVGRDLAETDAVLRGVAAAGTRLAVFHNRLHDPAFEVAGRLVAGGAVGRVHTVRLESLVAGHWPGTAGYDPDWRLRPTVSGGGALLDNGYHSVYLAEMLAGAPIESVVAVVRQAAGIGVDDVALVLAEHAGGAVTSIQVGWAAPGGGQAAHEVHGTEGTVAVHRDGRPIGVFRAATGEWEWPAAGAGDEWGFTGFLAAELPALVAGAPLAASGDEGRHVQAVIEAAYRSAASGRREPVGRPAPGVVLDEWDLRHLLLSIDDRPRPWTAQAELEAVTRRSAAALRRRPVPPPFTVPPEWLVPGAVLEGVPLWLYETNAWVLAPRGPGGPCVVVDVPPEPDALLGRIAELDLDVDAVLVTHGHLDHGAGAGALLRALGGGVPVFVHGADAHLLADAPAAGGVVGRITAIEPLPRGAVRELRDLDRVAAAGIDIQAVHVPGHTPGSTCFLVEGGPQPLLFTGDHLFAVGVGRADLPGGSYRRMRESMASRIAPMADDVVVLPGHGAATTLGAARSTCRLLAEVSRATA